jgi:hypothetical protein
MVPPLGIGGGGPSPEVRIVENVVMEKGGGVKVFHHAAEGDVIGSFVVVELGTDAGEERAESLASAPGDIGHDFLKKVVPGGKTVEDGGLNCPEIRGKEGKYLLIGQFLAIGIGLGHGAIVMYGRYVFNRSGRRSRGEPERTKPLQEVRPRGNIQSLFASYPRIREV